MRVWLLLFALLPTAGNGQLSGFGNAPDFTLIDLNGEVHNLYGLLDQNKVVILDFFAVWCGNCQASTPELERIYQEYGPEGNDRIEMLSLESDQNTTDDQVEFYLSIYGNTNPHINATQGVPALYEVDYYPTFYVIAPDRSFTQVHGTIGGLEMDLNQAIEEAPLLREVDHDIRVRTLHSPKGTYCVPAMAPELVVQNYGRTTIYSVSFEVLVDAQLQGNFQMDVNLNPYEMDTLRMPWITDLSFGWHSFSLKSMAVNSLPDGDPTNDFVREDFKIVEKGQMLVIETMTDAYPQETWWEIRQEGKIVAEQMQFEEAMVWHYDTVCVDQTGCYTLTLFDRYGDGIGGGQLRVMLHGQQLAHIDRFAFLGASQSLSFCLPGTSGIDPGSVANRRVFFPNPADHELFLDLPRSEGSGYLTLHTLTGQVVFEQKLEESSQVRITIPDLPSGTYLVRFRSEKRIFADKLIIL